MFPSPVPSHLMASFALSPFPQAGALGSSRQAGGWSLAGFPRFLWPWLKNKFLLCSTPPSQRRLVIIFNMGCLLTFGTMDYGPIPANGPPSGQRGEQGGARPRLPSCAEPSLPRHPPVEPLWQGRSEESSVQDSRGQLGTPLAGLSRARSNESTAGLSFAMPCSSTAHLPTPWVTKLPLRPWLQRPTSCTVGLAMRTVDVALDRRGIEIVSSCGDLYDHAEQALDELPKNNLVCQAQRTHINDKFTRNLH